MSCQIEYLRKVEDLTRQRLAFRDYYLLLNLISPFGRSECDLLGVQGQTLKEEYVFPFAITQRLYIFKDCLSSVCWIRLLVGAAHYGVRH